jgi:hypothetical protein
MQTETTTLPTTQAAREEFSLDRFFGSDRVDIGGLARHLDELPDPLRARAACGLSARQQARLFDAALALVPLSLDFFVPARVGPLAQVIHTGRNSLPFFTRFEKRFCRPDAQARALFGYNENPSSIRHVTGPGYFVCYEVSGSEVLIDYKQVPPTDSPRPEGWPAIFPNSAGGSRFIYSGTQDTMRGVSRHVSIGRAARAGKWMDNWFVLCRREN